MHSTHTHPYTHAYTCMYTDIHRDTHTERERSPEKKKPNLTRQNQQFPMEKLARAEAKDRRKIILFSL